MNDDESFVKEFITIFLKMFGILTVIVVLVLTFVITWNKHFRKDPSKTKEQLCYSNMRVLTCAVEMYNLDHTSLLNHMDDKVIRQLHSEKYLYTIPIKPEKNCLYSNNGDLTATGSIICKLHGIAGPPPQPKPPSFLNRLIYLITH